MADQGGALGGGGRLWVGRTLQVDSAVPVVSE